MPNIVYIATSLDGYIADKEGKLDWLEETPNPNHDDCGWADFMSRIDAIIMGRNTFNTVINFDCDWPYDRPVFVLSNTLSSVPLEYKGKAELVRGPLRDILQDIHQRGYETVYIDGGVTIQNFLKEDLIDEIILTRMPILLGGGAPLFGELVNPIRFEHVQTDVVLNALVKSQYRKRITA